MNVYQVRVQTQAQRLINVAATTPEEAQSKVTVNEGETIVEVVDAGELVGA